MVATNFIKNIAQCKKFFGQTGFFVRNSKRFCCTRMAGTWFLLNSLNHNEVNDLYRKTRLQAITAQAPGASRILPGRIRMLYFPQSLTALAGFRDVLLSVRAY
jgi:hypothetical protein